MLFHGMESKVWPGFELQTGVGWRPFDVDRHPDLGGYAEKWHVDKENEPAMLLGSLHKAVTLLLLD